MNRNFDRFKAYIMNSNLPEDLKKTLLAQAETLLKPNFEKKLNLNDMKELLLNEADLLKDPLLKQLLGADVVALQR